MYSMYNIHMKGQWIREIREALGLTAEELAALLGTGQKQVFALESERARLSGPTRAALLLLEAGGANAVKVLREAPPWRSPRAKSIKRSWIERKQPKPRT